MKLYYFIYYSSRDVLLSPEFSAPLKKFNFCVDLKFWPKFVSDCLVGRGEAPKNKKSFDPQARKNLGFCIYWIKKNHNKVKLSKTVILVFSIDLPFI